MSPLRSLNSTVSARGLKFSWESSILIKGGEFEGLRDFILDLHPVVSE